MSHFSTPLPFMDGPLINENTIFTPLHKLVSSYYVDHHMFLYIS